METITSRKETMDGIDYVVFPVVAIVEGVHNDMLYPASELEKFVESWNGIPVTVGHPKDPKGIPLSANSPDIVEKYMTGRFWNATFSDLKLKGEVWLDEKKTKSMAPHILDIITIGKMEVSTGLWAEGEGGSGTWNDQEYTETLINYRPDHLALLPNEEGACNWDDGCGVRVNIKKGDKITIDTKETIDDRERMVSFVKRAVRQYFNKQSHDQIRQQLSKLVEGSTVGKDTWIWVQEVFNNYFVYQVETKDKIKYYKQSYKLTKDVAFLDGMAEEVKKVVTYKSVNNIKEDHMNKADLVKKLIDNERAKFVEEDTELLLGLSKCHLENMVESYEREDFEPVVIPEGATITNKAGETQIYTNGAWEVQKAQSNGEIEAEEREEGPPVTAEQYVNDAPEEIREVLTNGLDSIKKEKTDLIEKIKANKANIFTDKQLSGKEIGEIRALAALANIPDYSGRSGSHDLQQNEGDEEEVLEAPVINWDDEKK